MNRLATTFILAASSVALAAPAFAITLPGSFTALDSNADTRVEFAEFATFAQTQGISTTQAAQHFTKMSAGDAVITEDEFFLATATNNYLLDSAPAYAVDSYAPVANVAPAAVVVSEPVQPEAVMASVETTPPVEADEDAEMTDDAAEPTEDLPEGALITTDPVEDVAGEVETYDATDEDWSADVTTDPSMTDADDTADTMFDDAPEEGEADTEIDAEIDTETGDMSEEDPLD